MQTVNTIILDLYTSPRWILPATLLNFTISVLIKLLIISWTIQDQKIYKIISNLTPETLTNGTILFSKYHRIDILIRENTVSSGIYTATFLEPAKQNTQIFYFLAHNLDYMYAGIAKIEFLNKTISVSHRMAVNFITRDPITFTYTILSIMGYK